MHFAWKFWFVKRIYKVVICKSDEVTDVFDFPQKDNNILQIILTGEIHIITRLPMLFNALDNDIFRGWNSFLPLVFCSWVFDVLPVPALNTQESMQRHRW